MLKVSVTNLGIAALGLAVVQGIVTAVWPASLLGFDARWRMAAGCLPGFIGLGIALFLVAATRFKVLRHVNWLLVAAGALLSFFSLAFLAVRADVAETLAAQTFVKRMSDLTGAAMNEASKHGNKFTPDLHAVPGWDVRYPLSLKTRSPDVIYAGAGLPLAVPLNPDLIILYSRAVYWRPVRTVAFEDGSVLHLSFGGFAEAMKRNNKAREKLGLPAIVDAGE